MLGLCLCFGYNAARRVFITSVERFPPGLFSTLEEIMSVRFPPPSLLISELQNDDKIVVKFWSQIGPWICIWLLALLTHIYKCGGWMACWCFVKCSASITEMGKTCSIQLVTQVSTVLSDNKREHFPAIQSFIAHTVHLMRFLSPYQLFGLLSWKTMCATTNKACHISLLFVFVSSTAFILVMTWRKELSLSKGFSDSWLESL